MYQGINDNYKNATTNFVFELQYHTPESWALKKDSHVIYEKFRVCQNPADLQKLFQEGVDLAASLPIPEGVESIPTLLKNPEPNLLSAYAYVISQNVHGVGDKLQNWFKEKVGESASIKVDADDEPTIEAELRMLIDQANEAIEDIVLSHYFFGLAVHVTIDEKHYAEVVDKLLGEMKAPKDGESIRVVSEKVMNSWEDNTNTKCIRVYAVAGSRATKFPQDNILFEVIFYTPKAQEVESKVATMLRQNKSSKNQEELNKAIEELWISCPLPDNFAAMKHLPTPHPPASPRAT